MLFIQHLRCLFPSLAFMLLHCFTTSFSQSRLTLREEANLFDTTSFKSCHASTLVELKSGKIIVAWFGGEHEGSDDVCIWMASKESSGWTAPVRIATGIETQKQYPCWNPVLVPGKKKLFLHYKVGPNPREWWAMYKTSDDEGKTWSEAVRLPDGFLGPIKNKPLVLKNGNILYPSSTESVNENVWKIHLEQSDAALKHWKKIPINCGEFNAIQPTLLSYADGRIQLLARSRENVIVQSWSLDNGKTWSALTKTNLPNPNSGIDAASSLDHSEQLLVYNPLAAGKDWWEGRSILKLATSTNGIQWKDIYTLEEHPSGEYSYPAIICDDSGNIHITYTDNRRKIKYVRLSR